MTLNEYFENVAFQFYSKVEEVDFFLQAAIDHHAAYASTPDQRTIRPMVEAQFYFSAFISALVSTWEIAKLTHKLAGELEGTAVKLEWEWRLASQATPFLTFFEGANERDFALFRFLKQARNATIHDGTLALNGGTNDMFCLFGPIDRFESPGIKGSKSNFQRVTVLPPDVDAIEAMRQLAVRLLPLFEQQLKRPNKLSGIQETLWKKNKTKVKDFVAKYLPQPV